MTFSISSLSSVFVYSSSGTVLWMNPDSSDGAPPKGEIQSESGFRHNRWTLDEGRTDGQTDVILEIVL